MPTISPSSDSTLVRWIDAETLVGTDGQIYTGSTNGYSAPSGAEPTYLANAFNGRPCLRVNHGQRLFNANDAAVHAALSGSTGYTISIVARQVSALTPDSTFQCILAGNDSSQLFLCWNNSALPGGSTFFNFRLSAPPIPPAGQNGQSVYVFRDLVLDLHLRLRAERRQQHQRHRHDLRQRQVGWHVRRDRSGSPIGPGDVPRQCQRQLRF